VSAVIGRQGCGRLLLPTCTLLTQGRQFRQFSVAETLQPECFNCSCIRSIVSRIMEYYWSGQLCTKC
jgi:hypothetical protein